MKCVLSSFPAIAVPACVSYIVKANFIGNSFRSLIAGGGIVYIFTSINMLGTEARNWIVNCKFPYIEP